MFDNFYTKYEDAKTFISEANADEIVKQLEGDIKKRNMTAEKYAYLSKACIFARDTKKAIKYAKAAIKADKKYPYGYIRLAFALARDGNKKETLQNCLIADELTNSNFLFEVFLAIFYKYCGDTDKARKILNKLEENNDNSAPYLYNLGFLYSVNQNDSETAEYYLQKALKAGYRDTYNLYSNLAECYSDLLDLGNAEFFVDKCLEVTQTQTMLEHKVDCLSYAENYAEAKKLLRKLYKTSENKLAILIKLAEVHQKEKNTDNALRICKFALDIGETDSTLYYYIGSLYEAKEEYEKAIEMYKLQSRFDRKGTSAYTNISYCYSQINEHDEALKYVEKALKLDKESSYIHYRKAKILTDKEEYDAAIRSFQDSLDYDKTDIDCYQWISYCYSMKKDFEKSLEYANRAIMLNKDDAYSYFRKAWALQEMKRYGEALNFYEECIKRDDKYIDAYVNISFIYSKTGDIKQSMLYANKAILLDKNYAYAHYRKAWAHQETGNFEEALDGYSKAMELDPSDIYNYLGIACVSLNTQANVNALLYANKALLIDRNCGGAYYYKSIALSNLGKIKEAEKAYAAAIELGFQPV